MRHRTAIWDDGLDPKTYDWTNGRKKPGPYPYTRQSANQAHKHVRDYFRPGNPEGAWCVCEDCGAEWPEGGTVEEGYTETCK